MISMNQDLSQRFQKEKKEMIELEVIEEEPFLKLFNFIFSIFESKPASIFHFDF